MIILEEISKSIGGRVLFDDVSVNFQPGCRFGLTGPNGAGKSTLLKILMKTEDPTQGRVTLPEKVGFLKQNIEDYQNIKVIDTVVMGNAKLWKAFEERDALYEEEMTDEIGMRLGDLEEIIAEEDGYGAHTDAEILLTGMGISPETHEGLMKEIPLDWQFRTLLCQALFGTPQALLLDEPTNHLDMESIGWLEGFLKKYTGTMIVVSHDRHFLNAITTHIADIDYETVIIYPGNYDDMVVAKTAVRDRAETQNKAKDKKISQLKEFVSKFSAGTRASQVQSRLREIERLQPQDLKKSNIQRPYVRFIPHEKQPGQLIFRVEHLAKTYEVEPVIKDFSFEVLRGDKIGVIGNNGRGKTTLLKMLANALEPSNGKVTPGHHVLLGYFPQIHSDIVDTSNDQITAFDWLKAQKKESYDQDIRGALGKMLFSGDDAFKPLKALSGGEMARLLLSSLMLNEPNVLILDEPNNHLDLEAVSALAWGLDEFKGTAIFSSHDRDLISRVANKLIIFEEDGIRLFDGNYDSYLEKKGK